MDGVVAYIQKESDDKLRLILNDVVAASNTDSPDWSHNVLFTSNIYDSESLKQCSLSKEQFAEIGENLRMRLLVIGGFLKWRHITSRSCVTLRADALQRHTAQTLEQEEPTMELFKILLDWTAAMARPALVLFVIIKFRQPISELIERIGAIADRAKNEAFDLQLGEQLKISFNKAMEEANPKTVKEAVQVAEEEADKVLNI